MSSKYFNLSGVDFHVETWPAPAGAKVLQVTANDDSGFELSLLCRKAGALTTAMVNAANLCTRHAIASVSGLEDKELGGSVEMLPDWLYMRDAAAVGLAKATYL